MRTTLTLDPDVAAALERYRRDGRHTLKAAVNEALRLGLQALDAPRERRPAVQTVPVSLGRCFLGSLDDATEALSIAEGEDFR